MVLMIYGILVLSFLVLIHELGHFLAAKWLKIPVLSFSIGFGKPLIKKKWGETEYRLSPIPFGGYVAMEGENPNDKTENGFSSRPVWQRALVAIAGPLFNLVSAFAFLWIMFFTGVPYAPYLDSTVVGGVADSTPAFGKIVTGDSIVSVNGSEVSDWNELFIKLNDLSGNYAVELIRDGSLRKVSLDIAPPDAKTLQSIGSGIYPTFPPVVGEISDKSPAMEAGIKIGDTIVAIGSERVSSWYRIIEEVGDYNSNNSDNVERKSLLFTVSNGELRELEITPKYDSLLERSLVGITVANPATEIRKYGFIGSFSKSWSKSIEYSQMVFDVLQKLITNVISPKHLSGPIGIMQMSGSAVKAGLASTLNLMALISINLGMLNLMPLVITDGGILLLLLVEVIRKKPVSEKFREKLSYGFMAGFLALFIFVTFNDISRFGAMLKLLN